MTLIRIFLEKERKNFFGRYVKDGRFCLTDITFKIYYIFILVFGINEKIYQLVYNIAIREFRSFNQVTSISLATGICYQSKF